MKSLFSILALLGIALTGAAQPSVRDSLLGFTSKFDFVSGEKVIALEDFSNTELGDFPPDWNTNATAEVVTLTGKPGKWMKINKESVFYPEFIKDLPENFTLEFDLGVNPGWNSLPFVLNITNLKSPKEYTDYYHYVSWKGAHTIHLEFRPLIVDQRPGNSKIVAGRSGNLMVNNDVDITRWDNASQNFAHVSLWRQNKRLRVYLNGEKIWDVQQAFEPEAKYNAITIAMQGSYKHDDYFVFTNLRLAAGAPDTRNKLFREGKLVSRGILFMPNSDEIRPESYGVLKEIGNVLKDSLVPVKIIGFTDADGDDNMNLDLSKRRAAAVKNYLVQHFGLVADSLVTEGMGEKMPIDKNDTPAGKANNRRVEFIITPVYAKQAGRLPQNGTPSPKLPITVKPKPKGQ
jgi:OOP family OmpA-OmpF porin